MIRQNCKGCNFEKSGQTKQQYLGDKPTMLYCNDYTMWEKKFSVSLYDEDGKKRNPLEVLKEVQAELEQPAIDGGTLVLDESEIDTEPLERPKAAEAAKNILWGISMTEEGQTEIHPMNSDCITIHGAEEMWFFICRLLDYYQK